MSDATAQGIAPSDPGAPSGEQTPDRVIGSRCAAVVELVAVSAAITVAAVGVVGLAIALLGWFSWQAALALGTVLAAGLILALVRSGVLESQDLESPRAAGVAAVVAVVLVAVWIAWAAWSPSEHVTADRDPASYLTTAVWLVDGHPLDPDVATGGLESLGPDEVTFSSSATFATGDRTVEFQFNHLSSVVLAVADGVGGVGFMLRVPALAAGLSLLVLYFVAVRCTRRPVLALLAPAVLAAGLPWLFVARDTYSESMAVLILWAAVVVLVAVHERPTVLGGVVGGVLLGSTVAVRVDALMYVAGAVVLGTLSVVSARSRDLGGRRCRAFTVAAVVAAVPVAVAQVDLWAFTGDYAADLRSEIILLIGAVVLALLVAVSAVALWRRFPSLYRRVQALPPGVATAAGMAVVVAFAGLWLVRPLLGEVTKSAADATTVVVGNLQAATGQPVEPLRTYAESTGWWMAWYLGVPAFVAAIAGAGLAMRRALRGVAPAMVVTVLLGLLGLGSLYLWRPSITPDQLWASRRYVPAVLPACALLAMLPLSWILDRTRPSREWRVAAVVVLATALIGVPAVSTWPLRNLAQQRGYLGVVLEACDLLGDDATVLVVDPWSAVVLPSALRAWCDVPVGVPGPAFDEASMPRLVAAAEAHGRRVVLVAIDGPGLSGMPAAAGTMRSTRSAVDGTSPEQTLVSLPDRFANPASRVPPTAPDGFQIHVRPVRP